MKKLLSLVMLLCLLAGISAAFAQELEYAAGYPTDRHAFGIHFGNVSGNGYAYRFVEERWGFQLVAGGFSSGSNKYSFPEEIYVNEEAYPDIMERTDTGRKYSLNLGANAILPLKRMENIMFYMHTGVSWFFSSQKKFYQDYSSITDTTIPNDYLATGEVDSSIKTKSYVNIGAGPGVEVMVGKYFRLSVELPVTYTGKDEFIMYIPQAGLYYYFR